MPPSLFLVPSSRKQKQPLSHLTYLPCPTYIGHTYTPNFKHPRPRTSDRCIFDQASQHTAVVRSPKKPHTNNNHIQYTSLPYRCDSLRDLRCGALPASLQGPTAAPAQSCELPGSARIQGKSSEGETPAVAPRANAPQHGGVAACPAGC